MDRPGVIVTAPGDGTYDFVSRYVAPAKGIPEDPVTGAAHCMLAPYWAKRLRKTKFHAYQASPRGGEIICRLTGNRIELEGTCIFYLEGEAEISRCRARNPSSENVQLDAEILLGILPDRLH
jgi:predicted PhzF superfamily epimerase YddE/YHI9